MALYTTTYTDVFSGNTINPALSQYIAISLEADITLSWPTEFQTQNKTVALLMDISPTIDDEFEVTMPDARNVGTGFAFKINNPSGNDFDLRDNLGNFLVTIGGGEAREIWLVDNTTQQGSWRFLPVTGGGSAVTFVNATSDNEDLVISGIPITGAGTIAFSIQGDLDALSDFDNAVGIAVRTAVNTWSLRDIVGPSNQIIITNGDGVFGNPIIALATDISGINSITAGNLKLSANTLSSVTGSIILDPQGTNPVELQGGTSLRWSSGIDTTHYFGLRAGTNSVVQDFVLPTALPVEGQVFGYTGSNQIQWVSVPTIGGLTTIDAVARYSNTGGSLQNSVMILDDVGNVTGLNSAQIGDILIGTINQYTITTMLSNQDLVFDPNGTGDTVAQSDIAIKNNSGGQTKLRLYNSGNTNYAGLQANSGMVNSYTWSLPALGGVAGIFYTDTSNSLSVHPFFGGPSTINHIATFSDTVGTLKDSGASLVSSVLTLGSTVFSGVGGGSGNSITSTGELNINSDTIISIQSTGTGAGSYVVLESDINVNCIGDLVIYAPTHGAGSGNGQISLLNILGNLLTIRANASTASNYTITLPSAMSAGILNSDSSGNLSINPLTSYFPGSSTTNAVPRFSNTTGFPLKNSVFVIDDTGIATGLLSLTAGDINMVANIISTTVLNENLRLSPNGTGNVNCTSNLEIKNAGTQLQLELFNSAGTFYTGLQAGAAAANRTFTLPIAFPAATGIIKSSSAGVMSIDSLGASRAILTTDGAGNVTTASGTTVANQLAKYTGTTFDTISAASTNTGTFLDSNNNLSIGTSSIGTSATASITLAQGTATTAAGGSILSIGNRTTGTGNVLALYGAGDGGVSASVVNTVTNKISVYVNGTRYYLLASTSGT